MNILVKKEFGNEVIFVVSPYQIRKNGEICNNFPILIIDKETKKVIAEFDLPHSLPGNDFKVEDLFDKDADAINKHFAELQEQNQEQIKKVAEELAEHAATLKIN